MADVITPDFDTAYSLNQAQFLLLCMKADTAVAEDVRSEIIAAILALQHCEASAADAGHSNCPPDVRSWLT